MAVGILFTFSFSIFIFLYSCSTDPWYTKLPVSNDLISNFQIGKYNKKEILISPLNSKYYKHSVFESIVFEKNFNFKKTYLQLEELGVEKKRTEKTGFGTYQINGNWILLRTEHIETIVYKNEQITIPLHTQKSNLRLLYYFNPKNKSILPMVSDLGFQLQNYGVKDLIKTPYKEKDSFFENSIKTYSNKDFYSDVYYLDF